MGRGKGKGKKLTVSSHEDAGSWEEDKIPAQKRRGRPQKPFKDEIDDGDDTKTEEVGSENKDSDIITSVIENGKKRKQNSPTKDTNEANLASDVPTKPSGFRHIGSKRKNKPRRAAEVGVECW